MQKNLNHIFEQAKNQKPLIPFQAEKVDKAMADAQSRRQPKLRFNHQGLPKSTILNLKFFSIMTGIALLISLVTIFSPIQQKTENETHSEPQIDSSEVISEQIPEDEIMKVETELVEDDSKKDLEPPSEKSSTPDEAESNNSTKEKKERLTCKIEDVANFQDIGTHHRMKLILGLKVDSDFIARIPVMSSKQLEALGFTNFTNGTVYFNKDKSGYYRSLYKTPSFNFTNFNKNKPRLLIDSVPKCTYNDFYPAYIISINPHIRRTLAYVDSVKNINLAPILLQQGTNHLANENLIAFFVPNEKFWQIVESDKLARMNSVPVNHELKEISRPKTEIMKVFEKTPTVNLDSTELVKFGFRKAKTDSTITWYYDMKSYSETFIYTNETHSRGSTRGIHRIKNEIDFNTNNIEPVCITTIADKGFRPYINKELLNIENSEIIDIIQNLVPIKISFDNFGLGYDLPENLKKRIPTIITMINTRIFWFEPSEELFSRLPDSIANELRKEYNINVLGITDDKTEKAECKFFQAYCTPIPGVGIIDLFPNPANDVINITIPHTEDNELTIQAVDLSGKRTGIHKKIGLTGTGEETVEMNIGELQPGMYLFVFSNQDGMSHSLRFIKN
ncbi:T9SS type A sorting domain-containing protein [Saccharicrinis sp. FJH54]|uniref:T9SS type A sorting domain-containing protein n=1 Tax=Saccharicrinis sp. FJH54 TaxID=3344665 RepID=UPI0035D3EBFA